MDEGARVFDRRDPVLDSPTKKMGLAANGYGGEVAAEWGPMVKGNDERRDADRPRPHPAGSNSGPSAPGATPVALVANACWYLWNFRASTLRALTDRGHKLFVVAPEDPWKTKLTSLAGVSFEPWRLDLDGANPIREGVALFQLHRILRRTRPGFVFNFTIKPNVYSGLVCRALGLPYANNVTGLGRMIAAGGWRGAALSRLYAASNAGARQVFVQNRDDAEQVRSLMQDGERRIKLIPGSGVDLDSFQAVEMPADGSRLFVFIGRLQEGKGVRDFVDAARQLKSSGLDAQFIILGSNAFASRSAIADDELDRWHREGVVEIVGAQEDVRPWLAQCHVLVAPSRYREGMPKVVLEAAAIARPSITTSVSGCREAVIDGQTGYLVKPASVPDLAAAMQRCAEMPFEQLQDLGRSARALAEARFSEQLVVNACLECLDALAVQ